MSGTQTTMAPSFTPKGANAVRILSIGIDISKDKLDLAFLYTDNKHSKKFVFDNNDQGIRNIIKLFQKQGVNKEVPCVIESTGDYHLQCTLMLSQAGFEVKLINPLITKKYQNSSVRNTKTDPIDALRLAQIGSMEPNLYSFRVDKETIVSKKLVSYLSHLENAKQRMKNSLRQMREVEESIGIEMGLEESEKALELIDKQIEELKKRIVAQAPKEAKELADACPGLSREKISILFSLISDKSFENRDQLVAFLGMDIALRKSGKWQGREKLTKRGSPIGRKTLYHIAWGLKQHNPEFQRYYERFIFERGKHYNTAMIALARKFLKFLHAYYWEGVVNLESLSR